MRSMSFKVNLTHSLQTLYYIYRISLINTAPLISTAAQ